jgi:2-hydroxy-6-oxonona-2,4-dienedioate hydrolase
MERLRSTTIRSPSFRFHARVSALEPRHAAPPVVLVHGLSMSHHSMEPTGVRLAPDFPVHIPDLPGFGKSSKPRHVLDVPGLADALVEYIHAYRLDRPVLLGNSFGCQIIMDLAARHRKLPAAVVLQGPTGDPAGRSVPGLVRRADQEFAAERPRHWWNVALAVFDAGARRARQSFSRYMEDRPELKAAQIAAPTLIVRGGDDALCPRAWARWLNQQIPRCELVEVPDAPHAMADADPDGLARLTAAFIERTLLAASAPKRAAGRQERSPGAFGRGTSADKDDASRWVREVPRDFGRV